MFELNFSHKTLRMIVAPTMVWKRNVKHTCYNLVDINSITINCIMFLFKNCIVWFITQCILIRLYSFGKSCSVVLWAFNQWFIDSSEETIKIRQRMDPYTFRMTVIAAMTVKTMLLYLRALWDRTDPSQRRSIDLLPSWHTRPSGWLIGQTGRDPETTSLSQSLTASVNHGLSSNALQSHHLMGKWFRPDTLVGSRPCSDGDYFSDFTQLPQAVNMWFNCGLNWKYSSHVSGKASGPNCFLFLHGISDFTRRKLCAVSL